MSEHNWGTLDGVSVQRGLLHEARGSVCCLSQEFRLRILIWHGLPHSPESWLETVFSGRNDSWIFCKNRRNEVNSSVMDKAHGHSVRPQANRFLLFFFFNSKSASWLFYHPHRSGEGEKIGHVSNDITFLKYNLLLGISSINYLDFLNLGKMPIT